MHDSRGHNPNHLPGQAPAVIVHSLSVQTTGFT